MILLNTSNTVRTYPLEGIPEPICGMNVMEIFYGPPRRIERYQNTLNRIEYIAESFRVLPICSKKVPGYMKYTHILQDV